VKNVFVVKAGYMNWDKEKRKRNGGYSKMHSLGYSKTNRGNKEMSIVQYGYSYRLQNMMLQFPLRISINWVGRTSRI